jgi:hypothetical protein
MTDTLENLRADIDTLRGITESQLQEIERLRAALQDIAIGVGESVLSQEAMRARAFDALDQPAPKKPSIMDIDSDVAD